MITLRPYDLIIKDVTDREGNELKAVNIRWQLATDERFIDECIKDGVQVYVPEEADED